jgi:hypothetical protein
LALAPWKEMTDDDSRTPDHLTKIDWLKTAAGALAAVTTAVLLSTLGAAGTLIGAALGSVVVTVSGQLYAQGLARSKRTMAKAQETALQRVGIAQAEVRRAGRRQDQTGAVEAHLAAADDQLDEARADLEVPEHEGVGPTTSARDRLLLLPWKKIGLTAAGLFLVALAVIASFEAVTGRSVSSYTGGSDKDSGSTFTGNGSSDDDGDRKDDPRPEPTEQQSEPTPSDVPTTQAPTEAPTQEPSETPTDAPSESPTDAPSETPSGTPEPSPTGLPTLPTAPTPGP